VKRLGHVVGLALVPRERPRPVRGDRGHAPALRVARRLRGRGSARRLAFALGILAAPLAIEAQQPAKVFRIGILGTVAVTDPANSHVWDAFLRGLRELGYVEGENLVMESR